MSGTMDELRINDIASLESDAELFDASANKIQNNTRAMIDLINQTTSVWEGEAQQTYTNRFNALEEDMQRIYQLCEKYHTDLKDIAALYRRMESENIETGQSTKTSISMS